MRLVRQQNEIDCGLAVAAMIAGTSWAKAVKADKNPESEQGLTVREFCSVCKTLGHPVSVSVAGKGQKLRSAPRPENAVAAIIRLPSKKRGHYIALDGDTVLDPETGRHPLRTYARSGWLLIRWFATAL